ncbi:MAG: penicillin-binding protein 1C [Burkholderiaceae bacterium]|nr:penicillin-binding protein 1C [Burkholderiaceae bacterium]
MTGARNRWPVPGPGTALARFAPLARAVFALGLAAAGAVALAAPSFEQVRGAWKSSEGVLLDRQGEPLQTLRLDNSIRKLAWVPIDEVSPALRRSLLISEDRRFLEHAGIDWLAVGSALGDALSAAGGPRAPRGASTITMQLAGLLDGHAGQGRRSFATKVDQAVTALALERSWRKPQIFEAYLNLLPFRGELVGIGALSELLFGKAPIGLDAAEAALAAALVRAPNAAPERVAQRACLLLREQQLQALCGGLEGRARLVLARRVTGSPLQQGLAPHLARHLLHEPGQRQRSTLDGNLQRLARDALRRHLRDLADRGAQDGAVVVLDNASGEVLAWVGSSGSLSAASEVDAVLAPRQAGSTLKPFLYAMAIGEHRLTAASLLEDRPANLPAGGGLYLPQNYDHQFRGWVSVRSALASSLNVPAVRVGAMITPEAMARLLRSLGMASVDKAGDHYGNSLALGSADVTLIELTNAYRALARGGRTGAARATPDGLLPGRRDSPATGPAAAAGTRPSAAPGAVLAATPGSGPAAATGAASVQALSAGASHIVADILSDRDARAATFGWDSPLVTRSWSAVKTGTSKDMRDSWCVGFSSRYTVGVWVGNAAGLPMRQVSGARGAAPVWAEVMASLHARQPSQPPTLPATVVRQRVHFVDVAEADRDELFLRGTQMSEVALASASERTGIAYPPPGTRIALDPDIPPVNQRVLLRAHRSRAADQARWWIDGRELGRGAQLAWFPMPGPHTIALRDAAGETLDQVEIEVRGALSAPRPQPARPPR